MRGLEFDRNWAVYALDGRLVSASRVPVMHRIQVVYGSNFASVTLSGSGDGYNLESASFAFPTDTVPAATWFSEFLEQSAWSGTNLTGSPMT